MVAMESMAKSCQETAKSYARTFAMLFREDQKAGRKETAFDHT
jgi:hypothetical protein